MNIQTLIAGNKDVLSNNVYTTNNGLVLGQPGSGCIYYIKKINGVKYVVKSDGTILEKAKN